MIGDADAGGQEDGAVVDHCCCCCQGEEFPRGQRELDEWVLSMIASGPVCLCVCCSILFTIFEFKIAPTSNSFNSKSFQPILVFFFLT